MIIPSKYQEALASLTTDEISFGAGGLHLFALAEIERGQVGYSIASNGASLCSDNEGAWQSSWIVIGKDTACGDPLIMETADPALPILRDFNGHGQWSPTPISISLDAFLSSFRDFAQIAKGRTNPIELESNPLMVDERETFLTKVLASNKGKIDLDFWEALLDG